MHPSSHFLATQHTFSMKLGKTQRVWDYIGGKSFLAYWFCDKLFFPDNYVHRLVQNKGDGKLVEVMAGQGQGMPSEEKVDSLQLEV